MKKKSAMLRGNYNSHFEKSLLLSLKKGGFFLKTGFTGASGQNGITDAGMVFERPLTVGTEDGDIFISSISLASSFSSSWFVSKQRLFKIWSFF